MAQPLHGILGKNDHTPVPLVISLSTKISRYINCIFIFSALLMARSNFILISEHYAQSEWEERQMLYLTDSHVNQSADVKIYEGYK